MESQIKNNIMHFVIEHLEQISGTVVGLFVYLQFNQMLVIPPFTDVFTEIVFKFLVAVVCGVGGGIGGWAVKELASLFKKDKKEG